MSASAQEQDWPVQYQSSVPKKWPVKVLAVLDESVNIRISSLSTHRVASAQEVTSAPSYPRNSEPAPMANNQPETTRNVGSLGILRDYWECGILGNKRPLGM